MRGFRLATLAFLAATLPGLAGAEMPPDGAARHEAAYAVVDGLIREAHARNTLPRLTDPREGPALRSFWDLDAVLGKPPYGVADVRPLASILLRQSAVLQLYSEHSVQIVTRLLTDGKTDVKPGEAFVDEQCHAIAAILHVSNANLMALVEVWAALPADQRTAQKQQFSVVYQVAPDNLSMALDFVAMPDISSDSAARLGSALRDLSAGLAGQMTLAQRASLAEQARAEAPDMRAEGRAGLAALVAALADTACEGLCKAR